MKSDRRYCEQKIDFKDYRPFLDIFWEFSKFITDSTQIITDSQKHNFSFYYWLQPNYYWLPKTKIFILLLTPPNLLLTPKDEIFHFITDSTRIITDSIFHLLLTPLLTPLVTPLLTPSGVSNGVSEKKNTVWRTPHIPTKHIKSAQKIFAESFSEKFFFFKILFF